MTTRATRDNSSSGSLFPFLAVLLCTMGALLVLLVVLAQNAGQKVATESEPAPAVEPQPESDAVVELTRQLEEVLQYQQKLRKLREQGESRLQDEQQRLSHSEEHARRIEHELAQLSLAAQQLEATENNQSVDREQAERELKRLRQLTADTEKQLEELREQASGKHSYAIVPYRGQNGTYRKPIYIECTAEGIILQPEGLRFQPDDFADLSWPGNPLAAALRASREYLIAKAARAGEPEPPDPYPLILVRPEGITQYLIARRAISSWDSDFGYEFIDGDWELEFPDLPDPQLARAQQHAVMIARERLARLVKAAPRRFRGFGSGTGGGAGGSRGTGQGFGRYAESAPDESSLAGAGDGNSATGNSSTAGAQAYSASEPATGESASADGEHQYGALSGDSSQGNAEGADSYASGSGSQSAAGESASVDGAASGDAQSGQQSPPSGASQAHYGQGGSSGGPGGPGSSSSSSASATANSGGPSSATGQPENPSQSEAGGSPSLQFNAGQSSIAESHGSDWAVQHAMRGAVPIRRPIHVVVRKNQMALLPSRHVTQRTEANGVVISLDQPLDRVSNEFVAALKTRVDEWGLAGNGLFWRPVLELHVGPDAKRTASKLMQLLENSGVDVRLPETAQASQGERANAPR